ncbi:MAG: hypothetical protein H6563_13425 [Lewinellaceae bacterium]|nr:hypothetical protein [Lewinellaceae bacterium]
MVEAHIQNLIQKIEEKQDQIIQDLPTLFLIDLLFDLSVIYEDYYAQNRNGSPGALQTGTDALGRVVNKLVRFGDFKQERRDVEQVQLECFQNLVSLAGNNSQSEKLANLLKLELQLLELESLQQTDKFDRSCEVKLHPDGKLSTTIVHQEGFKYEITTEWKYKYQISFFWNTGEKIVDYQLKNGKVILPSTNDHDANSAIGILSWEYATKAYLEQYGIEETFTYQRQQYDTGLLSQVLAFLIVYPQSRYGVSFEEHLESGNTPKVVLETILQGIDRYEDFTGPLFLETWPDMVIRMNEVFPKVPKEKMERHLAFFTATIRTEKEAIDLFQTPLLRMGNIVAIFCRPLMLQNPWLPLIRRLIGNPGDKYENARSSRAVETLSCLFEAHGFQTIVEYEIPKANSNQPDTDIDLAAFDGDHLFLFQHKMTAPKATWSEYKSHIDDALKEANRQNRKAYSYLESNWSSFREKWRTELDWEQINVHRIILSTSYEADRRVFSEESIKISQFELERYLRNDPFFLIDEDQWEITNEHNLGFYPQEARLSGGNLWKLIQENRLWSFLDKQINKADLTRYLPEFDPGIL